MKRGVSLGALPLSWTIAGAGDFDGDGTTDILWRNLDSTTSSTVAISFMKDGAITRSIAVGAMPASSMIAGLDDFNGDGKTDLLWRHASGQVDLWTMDGATPLNTQVIANATPDWTITGTGDFNGSGKSNILWRGPNGVVTTWVMDGGAFLASENAGYAPLNGPIRKAAAE